jgi:hypothetical protein
MYYTDWVGLILLYSFLYRLPSILMQQNELLAIDWAGHAFAAPVQHMRINHGGSYILMTEQLLNGSNVISILQQMGRLDAMKESCKEGLDQDPGVAIR